MRLKQKCPKGHQERLFKKSSLFRSVFLSTKLYASSFFFASGNVDVMAGALATILKYKVSCRQKALLRMVEMEDRGSGFIGMPAKDCLPL